MAEMEVTIRPKPDDAKRRLRLLQLKAKAAELGAQKEAAAGFNPDGTIGTPPSGMVLDERTGQMVDTQAAADRLGTAAKAAGTVVRGIPFVGEGIDEAMGAAVGATGGNEAIATETARRALDDFEEENPKTALGLRIAGGIGATVPAAVAAGPAIAGAGPASLGGQMLAGAATGAGLGAAEGAASGYLAGTDDKSRTEEAMQRAKWGAFLGGLLGVSAPIVNKAGQSAVKYVKNRSQAARAAKRAGLTKPSAEAVRRGLEADDAFSGAGADNLARAGDDAMLADAGPSTAALVDNAIQRSGPGAMRALRNIEGRASQAGKRFRTVLDSTLGAPQGVKSASKRIAQKSATQREAAYKLAFETPIDYAGKGRAIESVLDRIPDRTLARAIAEANDDVMAEYGKAAVKSRNLHIMADIAEDGSVTFRGLPNVQQLHHLKMALDKIGRETKDQVLGNMTPEARRAGKLAKDLRDALRDAVPQYARASKLGADKIAEENALRLGVDLLKSNTTRETVKDMADGITGPERVAAMRGLRQYIDDQMATVQRSIMDGQMDAREATKALKMLSSRANREKASMILGGARANRLFGELERVTSALDLRARVADNSKTFARQNVRDITERQLDGGVANAMRRGEPLQTSKGMWQALWNRSPQSRQEIQDNMQAEIADILTGPRGQEALGKLLQLQGVSTRLNADDALARALMRRATPALLSSGYHTGTQTARPVPASRSQGNQ